MSTLIRSICYSIQRCLCGIGGRGLCKKGHTGSINTHTAVKHSTKPAIEQTSDGPLEALEEASSFRRRVLLEINQLCTAEKKQKPAIASLKICRMPGWRSVRGEGMLVLKLRLEHGYNVNNVYFRHSQRGEGVLERLSFLKVISYGGACLPLTYAFAWCNSFDIHSGFFGYPTAVAFHICASYVKCNMNGQQAEAGGGLEEWTERVYTFMF